MPDLRHSEVPDHCATRSERRRGDLRPGGRLTATVTVCAKLSGIARPETLYRATEAVAVKPALGRGHHGHDAEAVSPKCEAIRRFPYNHRRRKVLLLRLTGGPLSHSRCFNHRLPSLLPFTAFTRASSV